MRTLPSGHKESVDKVHLKVLITLNKALQSTLSANCFKQLTDSSKIGAEINTFNATKYKSAAAER